MIEIKAFALTVSGEPPRFGEGWIDGETYGAALAALPMVCVDVVPVHRASASLVLANRLLKPGTGVWMFGGRVRIGESLHEAGLRHIRADLGLSVDPGRLQFLSVNQYLFDEREQPPQATPCHSVCVVFGLDISDAEFEAAARTVGAPEYASGSLRKMTPPFAALGTRGAVLDALSRACRL